MKAINKTEAVKQIKALGLSGRATGYGSEIRVNLWGGREATAYYTDDPQDAIDTARRMIQEAK